MRLRKLEQFFSDMPVAKILLYYQKERKKFILLVFDCGFVWSYLDEELKSDSPL